MSRTPSRSFPIVILLKTPRRFASMLQPALGSPAPGLPALLALTFLSRLCLTFRSEAGLALRLYIDDTFFVMSCARNLARGLGLSVDGVNPTNGLQPLIAYLYAPFFWLGGDDRWMGVHLTFIPLAIIDTLNVWLLHKLVTALDPSERGRRIGLCAAAIWCISYQVWVETMNGLETSLYSLLLLTTSFLLLRYLATRSNRHLILLGISSGFTILARIDGGIFVCFIALVLLIESRKLLPSVTVGLLATLISAPWWYHNLTRFGSFMPISGQSLTIDDPESGVNLLHYFTSLADISFAMFWIPFYKASTTLRYLWIAAGLIMFATLIAYAVRYLRGVASRNARALLPLALHALAVSIIYTVFFHAPYFIHRYIQPLRILCVLAFAALVVQLWEKRSRMQRSLMIGYGALGALAAVGMYFYIMSSDGVDELYRAGVWAREHPKAKVGMYQSGTGGFVADNVINLDGKVNAHALEASKAGKLGEYIIEARLTHLLDWERFSTWLAKEANTAGGCFTQGDTLHYVQVYQRCDLTR